MATYKANENLTYNLPDEGQVFRAVGDPNGDYYKVENGKVINAGTRQQIANTDLYGYDGSIIKAGTALGPQGASGVVDPNFRGGWTSNVNASNLYNQQYGEGAYEKLPEYNMADINQVLQKLGGSFTAGATGYTQGVAANNANAATITSNTGQLLTPPAPNGQPGAITPTAVYVNPNTPNPITGAQQSPGMAAQAAQPAQTQASPFGAAYGTLGGQNLPTTTQPTQPTQAAQAAQAPLTMPTNGSVVDLLSMAGQDSSFAARQALAQQYGIQGYTGTAAQNTELATKYLDAYNSVKGTAAPQSGAEARSTLSGLAQQTTQDPQAAFYDAYGSMNPVENQLFSQISQLMNTQANQQSLVDLYKQEVAAQGIPELNLQLADVNRIMNGTEQDIRDEVTKSGGFATNSQVLALASVRNKVLLQNAQYLTDVINSKNDYVDHIVQLTGADRSAVSDQIDQKLGIAKTVFDMTQKMQDNAKEGYQSIINEIGWQGLAQSVASNPSQASNIEQMFGLAPGELSSLASYKAPLSEKDQLALENQKLQNQKLQQDLAKVPASQVTPAQQVLGMSMQQQTISDTSSLVNDPGLNSAVGPNFLGRIAIADAFGAKSNFIASVEQLRQQLTLDKLVAAKGSGATFGALSDSELQLLSASASKLGTWAIKDNAGNVTGYNIDETSFKKELDKINNFQKLDYVLKGGDPASVGVFQASDGSLVTKNSDGSVTKL